MEDSLNRDYINISNRTFTPTVYNEEDPSIFSYKPGSAFWLSLPLESDDNYYSEWDREYRDTFKSDESGNLHATVVRFKPTTYFLSPGADKTLLEGFKEFTQGKDLTPDQRRKLLVELVRTHLNKPEVESVICQIDLLEDLVALEEIFGGYKLGNEYPDEVYQNLAANFKRGIRQNFSGLEVTAYALGMDKDMPGEGINETQAFWNAIDEKYEETIDYFDMHSVAVFDTSCLDVVKEIVYPQEEEKKQEVEGR